MTLRLTVLGLLMVAIAPIGCQQAPTGLALTGKGIALALPLLTEKTATVPIEAAGSPPLPLPSATGPNQPGASPSPTGGHGGGSVAGALSGRILSVSGAGESPLQGATVRTSDGREAVTASDGRFALTGDWPDDGAFVASGPGHVASAVVGLAPGGALTLHLQALTRVDPQPPAAVERVRAVGRVVDPDGNELPGLTVVLEDADGAVSAPATTGSNGDFELQVFAPGGKVTNGTLLAVGESGNNWIGLATGVTLSAEAPDLDLDRHHPGNSPLVAQPATHPLRIVLDATAVGGQANVALELVGAGATLAIPIENGVARVAALPGTHYALRAEFVDGNLGTQSKLYLDELPVNFQAAESVVEAAMLAPPYVTSPLFWAEGEILAWQEVTGAKAYHVMLAGTDDQGPLWEAFGTLATQRFSHRQPLAPGNYGLTVTAWDAPDLTPRSVMAEGPRALRALPLSRSYRKSLHQLRTTR